MLDSNTKRRIDACRDILVGKIPDPKAQVEQITIALIYKFMDDMDKENVALGGSAKFFTEQLQEFAWSRLLSKTLSGQERMDLYIRAIAQFSTAKQIPDVFRKIFQNAFVPYRDPETLNIFLKEIDYFDYKHSENLGDAFEYLLSVLGSQGDAGQFRTPRHIIDFIVELVDPQKNESILDPACGTAGFLISAYKHIRKQNSSNFTQVQNASLASDEQTALNMIEDIKGYDADLITPDDRVRLAKNIVGYDISPDMVRLSLVNLYLHDFPSPNIFEYDTLTYDDRWDERYDVILANPPFMSPKGGIKPHTKFGVQSNRSEVLFVDYIMSHLRPKGRAGIIVPEGIIFQSANAYKQLRKNMLDEGLVAVISLPPGVFNPYSGVKTSILIFDKELARHTNELLFIKIANDGFDLGAQRRAISKNDLPEAINVYKAWKSNQTSPPTESQIAFTVSKTKIAENGDCNLSIDRLRTVIENLNTKWQMVELGTLFEMHNGRAFKKEEWSTFGLPIIRIANLNNEKAEYNYYTGEYDKRIVVDNDDLLFSWSGTVGTSFGPHIWLRGKGLLNQHIYKFEPKTEEVNKKYAFYSLRHATSNIEALTHGAGGLVHVTKTELSQFKIPLPPLEIQHQIVAELDSYAAIITGAKQIVQNWKPKIEIDPEWEKVRLGEVLTFIGSGATPLGGQEVYQPEGVLFIRSQNILWGTCDLSDAAYISEKVNQKLKRSKVFKNDVLFNITGASIGRCAVYEEDREANVNQHVTILRCDKKILPVFLMNIILSKNIQNEIWAVQGGASRQALNYQQIKLFEIPLPPLAIQKQIVEKIEAERALVESAKKLIEIYEQKTEDVIAKLWSE